MANITSITKDTFDKAVLKAKGPVMVYYFAPWCKPCQQMDEVIQTAADEVQGKMTLVQVNTDQEADIIAQQKIFTIPTCQIFKEGKVISTLRGNLSNLELLSELSQVVTDDAPTEEAPAE